MSLVFALKKARLKRAGSFPEVEECLWKRSCFAIHPPLFVFLFVWNQNNDEQRWKVWLRFWHVASLKVRKKDILIPLNQLLSAEEGDNSDWWKTNRFCVLLVHWMSKPQIEKHCMLACGTILFLNISMIRSASHSFVSSTNRYSQITKKINSEWVSFSCRLHCLCSQTITSLLCFILP